MTEIRRIRPGERAAALETIVAAFRRDPQLRWWFPAEDEYEESAPSFFGVLLDTRIDGGEVWVADGGGAIVMWVPPGGNLIGPELAAARYSTMVAALQPAAAERIQRTDEAVDGLLPSGAHWYLGVLACHPDRQGTGLGWAVAAPVLSAADRAGLPVALETCAQANVGYYTRRGFAVIGEVPLADAVRPAGEPVLELVGHGGSPEACGDAIPALGVGGPQPGGPQPGGPQPGGPQPGGPGGPQPGEPGGPQPGEPGGGITVYVMRREPRG